MGGEIILPPTTGRLFDRSHVLHLPWFFSVIAASTRRVLKSGYMPGCLPIVVPGPRPRVRPVAALVIPFFLNGPVLSGYRTSGGRIVSFNKQCSYLESAALVWPFAWSSMYRGRLYITL